MAPRARKFLDPKSGDFNVRFALQLRQLIDKRHLSRDEFRAQLRKTGLDVSLQTVTKWLSGDRLPQIQDLEAIGQTLGLRDYRQVLPEATRAA